MSTETKTSKNVALEMKNVQRKYGDKTILEDINLKIYEKDFVSLIGPSGCGKSTLLRIAMGEELPSSGEASILGEKTNGTISEHVGIVYQKYSLFPHLTIKENLFLAFNKIKKSGELTKGENGIPIKKPVFELQKEFNIEYDEMIKLFRIDELVHKYPHQLSGGQQQRASIVQSLLAKPKILFMDEAFGALDIYTKKELKEFMDEYWKKHDTTIVFITHDLSDAVSMGNRVLLLSQYYAKEEHMGSKIVYDKETKLNLTPAEKEDLILHIKQEGFDPTYLQEI